MLFFITCLMPTYCTASVSEFPHPLLADFSLKSPFLTSNTGSCVLKGELDKLPLTNIFQLLARRSPDSLPTVNASVGHR